jgi:hypothetical protein
MAGKLAKRSRSMTPHADESDEHDSAEEKEKSVRAQLSAKMRGRHVRSPQHAVRRVQC